MLVATKTGCESIVLGDKDTHMQNLSKTIGKTLSSYTQAINNQNKTSGNLFQKKTKAKLLPESTQINKALSLHDYLLTCFHYIHQNPLKAKLVANLNDWPYSSYPDYYHQRNGTICNKNLTFQLLDLSAIDFEKDGMVELNDNIIEGLF
ncbi:MAG TPA: hypothetical protein VK498_00865 [Ferruginibacter sp.]|nr:hypothetical protein [Ferruginibacter sp.]